MFCVVLLRRMFCTQHKKPKITMRPDVLSRASNWIMRRSFPRIAEEHGLQNSLLSKLGRERRSATCSREGKTLRVLMGILFQDQRTVVFSCRPLTQSWAI